MWGLTCYDDVDDLSLPEVSPGEGAGVAAGVLLCPGVQGREASGHVVGEALAGVGDGAHKLVTHGHVGHGGSVGKDGIGEGKFRYHRDVT